VHPSFYLVTLGVRYKTGVKVASHSQQRQMSAGQLWTRLLDGAARWARANPKLSAIAAVGYRHVFRVAAIITKYVLLGKDYDYHGWDTARQDDRTYRSSGERRVQDGLISIRRMQLCIESSALLFSTVISHLCASALSGLRSNRDKMPTKITSVRL
jgi:hypothetical protein